jgi:UDP-N-acetylglucosamine--N-acetylmuramyl-(pentapeptide) pyrophosphoryl-undecaprenol N-acetylglucosamine transferase
MSDSKNREADTVSHEFVPMKSGGGRGINFIMAGGGTGGHIFPAVAIANAIKKLQPAGRI